MSIQLLRRPWGQFLTGAAAPQPIASGTLHLGDAPMLYAPAALRLSVDGDHQACV
jgi:hypothetical protein